MSSEPLVSVVIATYRASGHLSAAIKSAIAQSFDQIEIIVSDDGNSGEVANLVASFGDTRLIYLANPLRLGPAGNHWRGFGIARGRFLAVLNHDDLLRPRFVETLLAVMESREGVVIAFCDHDVIDDNGAAMPEAAESLSRKCGRDTLTSGVHTDTTPLVTGGAVPLSVGAMFRKSCLPEIGALEVGGAYDLYLTLRLAETGLAFYYVNERLAAWRRHEKQLTAKPDLMWARGSLACWELMSESPKFDSARRAVRTGVERSRYRVARVALSTGDFLTARAMALQAARTNPLNWRAWALLMLAALRLKVP